MNAGEFLEGKGLIPPWLSMMQNGALGEARVRAFLLERFWVSTRSVDIHGADFLIQTRDLSRRFTDLLPPRLGLVQAKFSQDKNTAHYVPRTYLYDGESPISEFFLILAVGTEDAAKLYLISAQDLASFPVSRRDGKEVHRVAPGAHLAKYAIKKMSAALDTIEQTLRQRGEADNDRFLKSIHIPFFEFRRRDVDLEWLVAIPNEHLFIPDEIYLIRTGLKSVIYGLEDFVTNAAKVLVTPDVQACAEALAAIRESSSVDAGSGEFVLRAGAWNLRLGGKTLDDAISTHHRRVQALKGAGRWNDFLYATDAITSAHKDFFDAHQVPKMVQVGSGYRFSDAQAVTTVKLDPTTLKVISAATKLSAKAPISRVAPFRLRAAAELWRYEFDFSGSGWRQLHRMHIMLMRDYYAMLFPGECVGPAQLPILAME